MSESGSESACFVDPRAYVESPNVGLGTRIWAFAHVQREVQIGCHCNICEGCFIENGVVVGDRVTVKNGVCLWTGVTVSSDVFIGPNAVFTNDLRPRAFRRDPAAWLRTYIAEGASIGANATVLCGINIGAYAMIAAGSVVTRGVAPQALMAGVPARQRGWVCICGEKLAPAGVEVWRCPGCKREFSGLAGRS